ncbi:T9SS type A sorting domain-containing protein [Salinivirga cyanobacteriivorans]
MKGFLLSTLLILSIGLTAQTTNQNGDWEDNATWQGAAPGTTFASDVYIEHKVTSNSGLNLFLGGTLTIGNNNGPTDSLTINGEFISTGVTTLIINNDGVAKINGDISNIFLGSIIVDGKLLVDGNFYNTGTSDISVSETGTIGVTGDFYNLGDVANDGNINVGGTYFDAGNTTGTGTLDEGHTNPLPVEFGNLTHEIVNDRVRLEWYTLSELNNDYFIIEKSTDMDSWTEVGRVNGNGTTSVRSDYTFDFSAHGEFYIQLKQFDYDGKNEVLKIIHIVNDGFKLYPNPVKADQMNVLFNNLQGADYRIFNQYGVEYTRNDNFEKGFYFVRVNNKMHKLIVE